MQNSALGTLKRKLESNPNVLILDRFFPSTRMCPRCGALNEDITLSDRTFVCPECGYTEERDVKSAQTMLLAGRHEMSCTCMERTRTLTGVDVRRDKSHETVMLSAVMAEASIL